MNKKIKLLAVSVSICILLTGCWDYRGLDTLDIVTGVAIDKDAQSGDYLLTLEIVDTKNTTEEIETLYVESRGETMFNAIRNSKKRLINQLYGGNMQTVVISRQIAETEGVDRVLEQLLRDGETRETLTVVISQEETAGEILLTKGLDSKIISYEIHEMVIEDSKFTMSTKDLAMYKAYEAVHGVGNALVLPAIRHVQNTGQTVAEVNGIALFHKDRLIGFESAKNTALYLFIMNEIEGGVLSIPGESSDNLMSMEIKQSKTKLDVEMKDGRVHISVRIKPKLNVTELSAQLNISNFQERNELEAWIDKVLEERITSYFQYVQATLKTDIFGLSNRIYQKNPNLWREIKDDWDIWFQNATLEVQVQANILTAGVLKNY